MKSVNQATGGTRDFLPDESPAGIRASASSATSTRVRLRAARDARVREHRDAARQVRRRRQQAHFKILKRGEHERTGEADLALRYDLTVPLARVVAAVPERAAEVLQAVPDSAGVARRPSGARPVPRVLSVRHRRDGLDIAGCRGGSARRGQRVLSRLGFQDFVVRLNHRQVLAGLLEAAGVPRRKAR